MSMTATQQFIEDAIEGGWMEGEDSRYRRAYASIGNTLLNPLAWQAVGKTRGWTDYNDSYGVPEKSQRWNFQMHRFIDHLADGKTIEEALTALEN